LRGALPGHSQVKLTQLGIALKCWKWVSHVTASDAGPTDTGVEGLAGSCSIVTSMMAQRPHVVLAGKQQLGQLVWRAKVPRLQPSGGPCFGSTSSWRKQRIGNC
jgi:hypothetical protein